MSVASIGRNVRFLRAVRWVQVAGFLVVTADLVRYLLEGHATSGVFAAVMVVYWSLLFCVQTKLVHLREAINRPRPDYASIAAMERDVYGETFEHEGAPRKSALDPDVAKLHAIMDDLAGRATARSECISCGYPRTIASGRCGACYRQWKERRDSEHRSNLRWERPS